MNIQKITTSLLSTQRLALLAIALLVLTFPSAKANGQQCNSSEPQVSCASITTPCQPKPGSARAVCSGGQVTPLSLGPVVAYHNSHKSSAGASREEGLGLGWSILERMELRDQSVVLISASGDETTYRLEEGVYHSEHRPRGDLSTIEPAQGGGYVLRSVDGSFAQFSKSALDAFYPVSYTNRLGVATTISYGTSSMPIPTTITAPGSAPISFKIKDNFLVQVTSEGINYGTSYNTTGQLTQVSMPGQTFIRLTYDTLGLNLITKITDPFNRDTLLSYTKRPAGEAILTTVATADGEIYQAAYSATTASINGPGSFTRTTYTPFNEQNRDGSLYASKVEVGPSQNGIIETLGETTLDTRGRRTKHTDSNGFTTSWFYGMEGDCTTAPVRGSSPFSTCVVRFDGSKTITMRDRTKGHAATQIKDFSADGTPLTVTSLTWLDLNRVSSIETSRDGATVSKVSYTYANNAQLPSRIDTESQTKATWDEGKGLVTSMLSADGSRAEMSYNQQGDLSSTTSDGNTVSFNRSFSQNGNTSFSISSPFSQSTQTSDFRGLSVTSEEEVLQTGAAASGRPSFDFTQAESLGGGVSLTGQLVSQRNTTSSNTSTFKINDDGSSSQSCQSTTSSENCSCTTTCKPNDKGGCTVGTKCHCKPLPTPTPKATPTPEATNTPKATPTVRPTQTPVNTATPIHTVTPKPTNTPPATPTPEPTPLPKSLTLNAAGIHGSAAVDGDLKVNTYGGGASRSAQRHPGTSVHAVATPLAGYLFDRWEGPADVQACGSDCTFNMPADDTTVTARFRPESDRRTLIVGILYALESGKVVSVPAGAINYGQGSYEYTERYLPGTTVTVRAEPNQSKWMKFIKWSSTVSAVQCPNAECTFTMPTTDLGLTAEFKQVIKIDASKIGQGTVKANPPVSIDCGSTCSATLTNLTPYTTPLRFTASADSGWVFKKWFDGPCAESLSPICSFTVSGDASLTARFVQCGDGMCAGGGENCSTCPADCGCSSSQECAGRDSGGYECRERCGNGRQDSGETCNSCSTDVRCPPNTRCNNSDACVRFCGNGICDGPENCANCESDCGCSSNSDCVGNQRNATCQNRCGNGMIDAGETCANCSASENQCPSGSTCNGYMGCVSQCTPNCSGRQCGSNGCGGSCGNCSGGQSCNANGQCVSQCIPNCSGRQCGSNGCGGSCGNCSGGRSCNANGQCVSQCTPNCSGRQCGSNGCSGSCGSCSGGQSCNTNGQCINGPNTCMGRYCNSNSDCCHGYPRCLGNICSL